VIIPGRTLPPPEPLATPGLSPNMLVVFTMAQIDDLHARFGRADSLADYFRGLAEIGVARFDSFVADGHSEFVGAEGQRVVSPPHHELLAIADVSTRAAFLDHLQRHLDGETSYLEMSRGLAASGVEKWVADTAALTMTYLDRDGVALLVEKVPDALVMPIRRPTPDADASSLTPVEKSFAGDVEIPADPAT
jgi:uncharacterized protein YbcV (DUF1398 family)